MRLLIGLVVSCGLAFSQASNAPNQITLGSEGLQGVRNISSRVIGNGGNNIFYYWIIPNYNIGQGTPNSVLVINAPNVLTASNYVQITWTPVVGANSYAVVRTTTSNLSNPCTGCLVINPQVTPLVNDQGALLGGYSYNQIGPSVAHITYDNQTYSIPRLLIDTPVNPTLFVNLPSAASSNGLIFLVKDSTSTGVCNAGGGTNTPSLCWSNGTSWIAIGGGGGGGGATIAVTTLPIKGDNAGNGVAAGSADIIGLFTACSGIQYLGADGNCHTVSATPGGSSGQIQVNSSSTFGAQASIFSGGILVQKGVECSHGTVGFATVAAAGAVTSTEITIQTGISGNVAWDQVLVNASTPFTFSSGTSPTVSMGRPGPTTDFEMTGVLVPIDSTTPWTSRPIPPQLTTNYSIVLNFAMTTGNVNALTAGSLDWRVCGYLAQ